MGTRRGCECLANKTYCPAPTLWHVTRYLIVDQTTIAMWLTFLPYSYKGKACRRMRRAKPLHIYLLALRWPFGHGPP
jgi:hypothetical protein